MQATITAVVLTKNEEKNIADCLSSLSWCDQIIVIDDESTDKTVEIAKKYKAQVYSHPMKHGFAEQRNFALSVVDGEWVFFLDADERVPLPLHFEILGNITNSMQNFTAYRLRRVDYLWGKKLRFGETRKAQFIRLAKKTSGKWVGNVHETWRCGGPVGILQSAIEHYPHQSIREFLAEVNHYTTLRAHELFEKKVTVTKAKLITYPFGKFLMNYLVKQGFRDGIPGIILALMMSFHSFLVRAKLWQLWVNENKK